MINISAGDTNAEWKKAIQDSHTESYFAGFMAGLDHFDGRNTHGTDFAHKLGLVAAYSDFYGQANYEHPVCLPGHSLP